MTEVADTSRADAREQRPAEDTNDERQSAVSTTTAEPETAENDSPSSEAAAVAEPADARASTEREAQADEAEPTVEAESAPSAANPAESRPAEAEATVAPVPGSESIEATAAEATATAEDEAPADEGGAAPTEPSEVTAGGEAEAASPTPTAVPSAASSDTETTVAPVPGSDAIAASEAAPEAPTPTDPGPGTPRPELLPFIAALENKTTVRGTVIGWNKGGFHISLDGVPAFCPKSQIEQGNPRKSQSYVDNTYDFRVIEIKEDGKRIVVSRAAHLAEERSQVLDRLRGHQRSGEPLEGRVSSITDFGAFVDVGAGVEGLVHLTALSRQRVDTPRDVVEVGQEVKVKVLKIEKGGDRISLSMKALEPDPWKGVSERYPIGSKHSGKVLRKVEFGLFVELEPGLEGLVHTSQLPLGSSLDAPAVAEGVEVEVWVRETDEGRRRLSLAMREVAEGDPWKDIKERYEEGSQVKGIIEQVARFGVFVQIEPGLTALLPFSSVSLPVGSNPTRLYRPGEELEAQVAEIDVKRKRMSLAPVGTKLEGTKTDLREFQKRQKDDGSLNAMAAAFAKLQRD